MLQIQNTAHFSDSYPALCCRHVILMSFNNVDMCHDVNAGMIKNGGTCGQ